MLTFDSLSLPSIRVGKIQWKKKWKKIIINHVHVVHMRLNLCRMMAWYVAVLRMKLGWRKEELSREVLTNILISIPRMDYQSPAHVVVFAVTSNMMDISRPTYGHGRTNVWKNRRGDALDWKLLVMMFRLTRRADWHGHVDSELLRGCQCIWEIRIFLQNPADTTPLTHLHWQIEQLTGISVARCSRVPSVADSDAAVGCHVMHAKEKQCNTPFCCEIVSL